MFTIGGKEQRRVRTNSIRKTLQVTNIVIILATLVPFLINTLYYNFTLNQYERIIENVYSANSLSSGLQDEIYITIWNVVAGKTRFEDNTQYELIDQDQEPPRRAGEERQQRGRQLPDPGRAQHAGDHRELRGQDRRQYRQRPARP